MSLYPEGAGQNVTQSVILNVSLLWWIQLTPDNIIFYVWSYYISDRELNMVWRDELVQAQGMYKSTRAEGPRPLVIYSRKAWKVWSHCKWGIMLVQWSSLGLILLKNVLQFLYISAHNIIWSNRVFQYSKHLCGFCGGHHLPVSCMSEVLNIRQNQIQHMKLLHFSYITLLKLQHILIHYYNYVRIHNISILLTDNLCCYASPYQV